jgi:Asp-tRNA(Asn)/Glu-tRNA(Gln) amidotransferase A subunit family amidase
MRYDMRTVPTPRLAGAALAAAVRLAENRVTRPLVVRKILESGGVDRFRAVHLTEAPSVFPPLPRPGAPEGNASPAPDRAVMEDLAATEPVARGFRFESVADFGRAYREGRTDPVAVASRLLAAIEDSDARPLPLRAMISVDPADVLAQAGASAGRHAKGVALGPLDGVPVAIKDEFDVRGYVTTGGTRIRGPVAATDATAVAALRAAGAVLMGKANMHEIGMDITGFNAHHGTARNPYDPEHYSGGSSSGPAVAVAAGLCPIALGADGGGSIRIPSSLCGLVGLKPTWSRVSVAGAFPLGWSIGHAGPLAATVVDLAVAYGLVAGPDPRDPNTLCQPLPELEGVGTGGIEGLRLGVYADWFEHASPQVVARCRTLIEDLEARGAVVVEVEIPGLELARVAHAVTILSEMATAMDAFGDQVRQLSHPARLTLVMARALTARDYVRAQQARTRTYGAVRRALEAADVILTPATATTSPRIPADLLPHGESDLDLTSAMMRFVFLANLTGHPAIAFPAGYDDDGLPVGLQAIGRPWSESTLLRLARIAEEGVERRAPPVHYRLLDG